MTARKPLDPLAIREVLGAFPTGLTVVAALLDGEPIGLAANSFTSVSLEPPIVSVSMGHRSTTWPRLRTAPQLGISVLGEHQETIGHQLSGPSADRFVGLDWRSTADGAVLIDGASAWLEGMIYREVPAGDHDIILLRLTAINADHRVEPLVFHRRRFRQVTDRTVQSHCAVGRS
jgi:flavin reductase (DIM6/NTAB) family NADH-FMN oxidoreductase RutF